uniref:Uncharacterized protein n=1 Tax=Stomoxys calcitrans TaxID=35570 RepID=A0A1I8Q6S5_STOCA
AKALFFKCVETGFNKDYMDQFSIDISEDHSSFNAVAIYNKDIDNSYYIKLVVDMFVSKTKIYRTLFNFEGNICDLLGNSDTKSINLFSTWMQNILKYSDMPKSCPIRK